MGLNLTAADYVIHMDPWWNPSVEDQAFDRAHRSGQMRPVTIYRLVAKGTIEEQIVDLHSRKRDLADRLLEGTDAPARLDADELVELLKQSISPSAPVGKIVRGLASSPAVVNDCGRRPSSAPGPRRACATAAYNARGGTDRSWRQCEQRGRRRDGAHRA